MINFLSVQFQCSVPFVSLSLTSATALALANTPIQPVAAQEDGSADDLGVMEINLKDAVQFNWGFQGAFARSRNTQSSWYWCVSSHCRWRQQRLLP
ncbi:hypothetical protein PMIT1342_00429 [Prochlorococcus marinus str. MIT 1342]|nr:hypothetical protein PMIT1342_00429 [Prochlorococcus marinus str. MIT 1342]